MRSPLILIVLVGIVPLLVLALVVEGSGAGVVEWQPPNIWNTRFGAPNALNGVTALATDTTGLYAAGFLNGTTLPTIFIARYNLNGNQVWIRQNRVQYSVLDSVAVGTDGVYVGELLNGSAVVLKYDLNGRQVWTNQIGSAGTDNAVAVSVGSTEVYAGAVINSGNGTIPVILRKYDFVGNIVWTRTLGNSGGTGVGIAASNEDVYLTGVVNGTALVRKYDSNGTLGWTRVVDSSSMIVCPCWTTGIAGDGTGFPVIGYHGLPRLGLDGFLRKYDANGNQLWTAGFGAPDHSGVGSVEVSANPTGIYVVEPTSSGNTFVMKYDGNGNSVWSFQMRGLSYVNIRPLAFGVGENTVYVGGSFGTDAYIAEFSQSSSLILFGLNPPLSFTLVGLIVGVTTVGILWFRRRRRKKISPVLRMRVHRSSNKPSNDPLQRLCIRIAVRP